MAIEFMKTFMYGTEVKHTAITTVYVNRSQVCNQGGRGNRAIVPPEIVNIMFSC